MNNSTMPPNFKEIQTVAELPQSYCTVTMLVEETMYDTLLYALAHAERQVYWLTQKGIGIWYSPMNEGSA